MPPCTGTSTPRISTSGLWLTRKPGRRLNVLANQQLIPHSDTLTAIHRTNVILPKILPPATSSVWEKFLRTSANIQSGAAARRHRIAGQFLSTKYSSQSHSLY